jgi:predicted Na+-dependent transporter
MQILSRYFGVILLTSCIIGMLVPSVGELTSLIVIVSLAFIIFCSFFQIDLSMQTLRADFRISSAFYVLRYLVLPVSLYFAVHWFSDFYALVVLLTFLLPSAVSSPAFSLLFGGKPDLSLKILLFSSFLSIVTIPFLMSLLAGSTLDVPAGKMLLTLVYTIVVPFFIHLPLRKIGVLRRMLIRLNSLFVLLCLSMIFVVVTAKNKPVILENLASVALYAVISIFLFALMYFLGYSLLPSQPVENRRTFSISSGANNIGLGVTLTTLFFAGQVNVFFIVSQLTWILALIPLRRWRSGKG